MKILLVHNFYSSATPSGENQVVEAELKLLRQNGHEVQTFFRYSDDIIKQGAWGIIKGAFATPLNLWMLIKIRYIVQLFQPDVVHVHNTFPLISPAIFFGLNASKIRVMTLHNYRILCANGLLSLRNKPCKLCIEKSPVYGLLNRCYRNSYFATLPLVIKIFFHKMIRTWHRKVDAFCVMTEEQKNILSSSGISSSRIFIKPNFFTPNLKIVSWRDRQNYVVFIGRLTVEKGIEYLIQAWSIWGAEAPELRIIGDGPLRDQLIDIVARLSLKNVKFLGFVSDYEKNHQLSNAKLLVMPSFEYTETFGLVLIEAFAYGVPVGVSDVIPMNKISKTGITGISFDPADQYSLYVSVKNAWERNGLLEQLGVNARLEYESRYSEESNYKNLMDIYQNTINYKNN